MAVVNEAQLSSYVTSMAKSAREAQAVMSTGADPMVIEKFRFLVNISAEFTVGIETDIALKVCRLNIKQKITIGYKSEWGLEIECTIIPVVGL